MQILNIAGYKFIPLIELENLRAQFLTYCAQGKLKGTILLSHEGINLNLAGTIAQVQAFKGMLEEDIRFADMTFRESYSITQPFKRLKVKLKKEIITLKQPDVEPAHARAPEIAPEILKQWLDEKRDITLLDTRNDYEVRFGTFTGAINLQTNNFCEFPKAIEAIERDKPIVMFCTGGIRCEKAAIYMLNQGYKNVYQLDGGILNYFAQVGGEHYDGECYVFDERISLDSRLQSTGTVQCIACQGPVTPVDQQMTTYISGVSCPACAKK